MVPHFWLGTPGSRFWLALGDEIKGTLQLVENDFELRDGLFTAAEEREAIFFLAVKEVPASWGRVNAVPPTFFADAESFLNIEGHSIVGPPADGDIIFYIFGGLGLVVQIYQGLFGSVFLVGRFGLIEIEPNGFFMLVLLQLYSDLVDEVEAWFGRHENITNFQILQILFAAIKNGGCSLRGEVFLVIFTQLMNTNYGGNLLRNSYGYQISDHPVLRGQGNKGFPMPQSHPNHNADNISSSLRQMESKIEGLQGLAKKKTAPDNKEEPERRVQKKNSYGDEPLGDGLLRGSCQNILKKFDYSNLRNTTHFNPTSKPTTHQQLRRSPQDEQRHMHFNKTFTQEYTPSFLKADKNYQESHGSFVTPNRTPPKIPQKPETKHRRTPSKYRTMADTEAVKTSIMNKSPEHDDKTIFRSLNEIVELKQREKIGGHQPSRGSKVINGFEMSRTLGKGKFGEVFLSRHRDTGFIAAIKKIEKKKVVEYKMVDQFTKEIRLHSSLDHPNIVKFFGAFEEKESIYLVIEYMNGGTLFDYLNQVPTLPVRQAAEYLKDIIEALSYMHDKSIAHRDIKPQNIVISSEGVAKLCDFGWSALVETSRKTYCGTFDYAPPQILQRKNYDISVDLWCIGVLIFELLTGRVPFEGQKRNDVMEKILNVDKNKIEYPIEIPIEAKELIQALVQKDPALRPRCQDILKFRFFTTYLPKGGKSKKMMQ